MHGLMGLDGRGQVPWAFIRIFGLLSRGREDTRFVCFESIGMDSGRAISCFGAIPQG